MRPAKCRICGTEYIKQRLGQKICSPGCAIAYAKAQVAKESRKIDRAKRIKMKTRSDWLREAQTVFNRWVRTRDDGKPCISCGRNSGAKMNAGHYRSVGACPELRFHPMNVNLQCEHCNSYLSGNIVEYRKRLVVEIGIENVEWIEGDHQPLKMTEGEIVDFIGMCKGMIRGVS